LIQIFQEITQQSSRAGVNTDNVAVKSIPAQQSRQQLDIEVSRTQTEHERLKARQPRGVASLFFAQKQPNSASKQFETDDDRQRKSIVKAILRFKTMSGYNADTRIQRSPNVGNDGRDLHPISEEPHEISPAPTRPQTGAPITHSHLTESTSSAGPSPPIINVKVTPLS